MAECCVFSGLKWVVKKCCPKKVRTFLKRLRKQVNNVTTRSKRDDSGEILASIVLMLKRKKESSSAEGVRERKRRCTANERWETTLYLRKMEAKRMRTSTGSAEHERKRLRQDESQDLVQQVEPQADEHLEENWSRNVLVKSCRSERESGLTPKGLKSFLPMSVSCLEFHFLLGRGGFGKVMLASVPGKDSYAAVKMIDKKSMPPQYILTERRILELAKKSPFLCHGYAAFQTETTAFLLMEYMSEGSMEDYMGRVGCMDDNTAAFYSAEMICGIQFLHSQGIIHRDLKPDNVLLDGEGHVKISDFGLAAEGVFGNTLKTGHCGTFLYMAPEIHLKKEYGVAVDWWAFGVMLFRMLNGAFPYYTKYCKERKVWTIFFGPLEYSEELSQPAVDILRHLLKRDPQLRLRATENIRQRPFFQSISWENIESRSLAPPYQKAERPHYRLGNPQRSIPLVESSEDTEDSPSLSSMQSLSGLSFVSPDWV